MADIDYPYQTDRRGRTATTADSDYIRDLIEQVLFTSPGERVNRPTFGSGLLQMVFAPNSDAMATATQVSVNGSLQQWLGHLIQVEEVGVDKQDSQLKVTVSYRILRNQQRASAEFRRTI